MIDYSDISLVISLIGFQDKISGRTRIQKEMCVLKHRDNINMNFVFKPYYYGPYSDELADACSSIYAFLTNKLRISIFPFLFTSIPA